MTIATNMAGRGTDIMLGGNAEYHGAKPRCAGCRLRRRAHRRGRPATPRPTTEEILDAPQDVARSCKQVQGRDRRARPKRSARPAACIIIGTERHESRRIDNQLRGRAGRQGDPGESRFYLSLEDDLMRLFGGERITAPDEHAGPGRGHAPSRTSCSPTPSRAPRRRWRPATSAIRKQRPAVRRRHEPAARDHLQASAAWCWTARTSPTSSTP